MTCISAAIIRSAADDNASKKYIDMLCTLCVICALVLPVFPLIPYIDEYSVEEFFDDDSLSVMNMDGNEIYNNYLRSVSVEQAELYLESEVSAMLDLDVEEIDVRLISDNADDCSTVTETVVYLSGEAIIKDPAVIIVQQ